MAFVQDGANDCRTLVQIGQGRLPGKKFCKNRIYAGVTAKPKVCSIEAKYKRKYFGKQ